MQPSIPHIDFGPFLGGTNSDRHKVALEVDAALCSVGSFYLHNHGIDRHEGGDWLAWSEKFFNLPEHEKTAIPFQDYCGYSAVGKDKVREQLSLKESFDCGNPNGSSQQNHWPSEDVIPGFRGFTEKLFKSCTLLVHQLLRCLSLALELDSADGLDTQHAASAFNLSLIHYPALSMENSEAQQSVRNAAHSDFGSLSLLFQDDAGGLEVADMSSSPEVKSAAFEKNGKFIHVDPEPGAILVVVGYLMMRRSNSRWKNTVHRVAMPPKEVAKEDKQASGDIPERYSLAFFATPDPASIIEPLACCCNDQNPKKWGRIDVGAYLRRKREAAHIP